MEVYRILQYLRLSSITKLGILHIFTLKNFLYKIAKIKKKEK